MKKFHSKKLDSLNNILYKDAAAVFTSSELYSVIRDKFSKLRQVSNIEFAINNQLYATIE